MVIPVVVEMRVTGVIAQIAGDRTARAGVEVETAMRPRRDTGGTSGKSLAGRCRDDRLPSTRIPHFSCAMSFTSVLFATAFSQGGGAGVDFFS
jgi:hypothetical protein